MRRGGVVEPRARTTSRSKFACCNAYRMLQATLIGRVRTFRGPAQKRPKVAPNLPREGPMAT